MAEPDPASLIEAYFERGWTDGLPVVPPTEKSVAEMLAGGALRGDEILGEIAGRNTVVVADKVAINAVLAGCRPEYMDAAICAPSGGNRQNWSFVVVRDPAKRARLGELYREAWGELMKVPYYAGASKEPADSPAGKMLASARHLAEHLGEAPVIVIACVELDPGVKASLTTGASIYPAVQNM